MRKNSNGLIPILLILVFIVLLFFIPLPYYITRHLPCKLGQLKCPGGWQLGSSLFIRLFQKITDRTKSEVAVTTSSSPESHTNWKILRNDKYGFELKLPANWREVEHSSNFDYIFPYQAGGGSSFELIVLETEFNTLDEYLEQIDGVNNIDADGRPYRTILESREIRIAGYPGIERKEELRTPGFIALVSYFLLDNKIFSFTLIPYPSDQDLSELDHVKDYYEILSNFKYLGKS